ncbi:F0F1 ATP synthase subunit delta [Nocardioides sp.]|uniref:F0F1 ATP synthase subunit delta n=1 Tax=Nocardioides sp. TaxID=35761 RepID=UPI0035688867
MTFRGTSADAFAAISEELKTVVSGSVDAAKVGEDLFSVAAILRREPSLRRVLTDVSVAGEAKSALVRDILAGKIDDAALGLVADAASRRWTAGRDLGDALEHIGVEATVRSAGSDSGRLADELFAVGQLVKDTPELRDALSDPARSDEDKRALLQGLLDGKALSSTLQLAQQSIAGSHRTVGVALKAYQQIAAEVYGEGVATVRVAKDLSDSELQRLTDALTRQYGRSVHLNVVVSPEVIGGMRVEIGDDIIDGTVSGRLDDARRKLVG